MTTTETTEPHGPESPPVPEPGAQAPTTAAPRATWWWWAAAVPLVATVVVGTAVALDALALLVLLGPHWPVYRHAFGVAPVLPTLAVSLAVTAAAAVATAAALRRAGIPAVRRRATGRRRTPRR